MAAIAALWSGRRDRSRSEEELEAAEAGQDAEGGPGRVATFTTAPLNAGAAGVDSGQLAGLTEVYAGEISSLEKSLEAQRQEFGQTSAARAQEAAAREARIDTLEERLEKVAARPPENTGRKSDKGRQESQTNSALARARSDVMAAYRAEGVDPPNSATVTRIAGEVSRGERSIAQLRGSIRNNERRQGRNTAAASRAYWSSRPDKAGSPGV